jgi:phage portal protein BeeE
MFTAEEVCHYAPKPDPDARFRGMSYLRPVLRQVRNQNAYAGFLSQYWDNAATPNLVMKFPPEVQRQTIEVFRDLFNERHEGSGRAFRTAFLGGGADPVVVGANLSDLASEQVSAYEFSQICGAAGVPPVVVTIVPGLESASTYANYQTAMRSFADLTVRPLWRRAAIKLRPLIGPVPSNAELWYDVSGVSALQSDAQDDANTLATNAQTIRALSDGGWEKTSVVDAVTTGDLTRLKDTGLISVQLLPPGQQPATTP